MSDLSPHTTVPRPGMLATVRNRRGVIAAVQPFDGETGRLHLVHLEYQDNAAPSQERLLWELEPKRELDEPLALPRPDGDNAMRPREFDALLRAARWTALSPYLDPDGAGPLESKPLASPFHGSVRVEDYQLVPPLKALRMPRVSLLIADDVGLGKTVEAGLILTELLLRRRIRRVLVLTLDDTLTRKGSRLQKPASHDSTGSTTAAGLKSPKDLLALGQVIVRQLELAARGEVLEHWLARHLAEAIAEADNSVGPSKIAAEARAVDLILKLWRHRRALPDWTRANVFPTRDTGRGLDMASGI